LTFQRRTLNDDGEPLTLETCKANPLTVPVPGSRYINSSLAAFTQVRAEDVALRLLAITGTIRSAFARAPKELAASRMVASLDQMCGGRV